MEVGVQRACAIMHLEFEGRAHRGVDDAFNIARILCCMLEDMRV